LLVLLLDLIGVLLGLFDVSIQSICPEGKDNEQEEEAEGKPSLDHGHISWGNTAKDKIQPDVSKKGGD